MPVHRVDLLVDDPDPVMAELGATPPGELVRSLARETVVGWVVTAVFAGADAADAFRAAHADDLHAAAIDRRRAAIAPSR